MERENKSPLLLLDAAQPDLRTITNCCILYYIILYYIILHYIALHYIILYYYSTLQYNVQ